MVQCGRLVDWCSARSQLEVRMGTTTTIQVELVLVFMLRPGTRHEQLRVLNHVPEFG